MRLVLAVGIALLCGPASAQSVNCTTIGWTTNCFVYKGIDASGGGFWGGVADGLRASQSADPPSIVVLPKAAPSPESTINRETLERLEEFRRRLADLHLDPATEARLWQDASKVLLEGRELQIEMAR